MRSFIRRLLILNLTVFCVACGGSGNGGGAVQGPPSPPPPPPPPPPTGSVITVNTTDDELNTDGDCSLREAIRAANTNSIVDACTGGSGPDDIVFDAIVVPATFALSISGIDEDAAMTGDLDITDDLTITGGGSGITIIDAMGIDRVFDTFNANTFNLTGLTVQGGAVEVGAGIYIDSGTVTISDSVVKNNVSSKNAGGIRNWGTLNISYSSIIDNTAGTSGSGGGGGIDNDGTVTITNSTIAGNSSFEQGGGIFSWGRLTIINTTFENNTSRASAGGGIDTGGGGFLTINNSTISGNTASLGGGGIINEAGTLSLQNTIVAGNSDPSSPDCSGSITSQGNNLIGDITGCGIILLPTSDLTGDSGLGGFVDDGMPGEGHFPLLPNSQAIDTGENSACLSTDQLGNPRPVDGDGDGTAICDIGALEY